MTNKILPSGLFGDICWSFKTLQIRKRNSPLCHFGIWLFSVFQHLPRCSMSPILPQMALLKHWGDFVLGLTHSLRGNDQSYLVLAILQVVIIRHLTDWHQVIPSRPQTEEIQGATAFTKTGRKNTRLGESWFTSCFADLFFYSLGMETKAPAAAYIFF